MLRLGVGLVVGLLIGAVLAVERLYRGILPLRSGRFPVSSVAARPVCPEQPATRPLLGAKARYRAGRRAARDRPGEPAARPALPATTASGAGCSVISARKACAMRADSRA